MAKSDGIDGLTRPLLKTFSVLIISDGGDEDHFKIVTRPFEKGDGTQ